MTRTEDVDYLPRGTDAHAAACLALSARLLRDATVTFTADMEYLRRRTLAHDAARMALARRQFGFALRRAVRDAVIGWAVR